MSTTEEIQGTVDRVVFSNAENGFAIVKVETDYGLISAKGDLAGLMPGEEVVLTGTWQPNAKYGGQDFVAKDVRVTLPNTAIGIEKYLGTLEGIGERTAYKLVQSFGAETLDVARRGVDELVAAGIDAEKAATVHEAVMKHAGYATAYAELAALGVPKKAFQELLRRWHADAPNVVRENPYKLMSIKGIGWKIADEIGRRAGIAPNDPRRVRGAIEYVLEDAVTKRGHCFLTRTLTIQRTCQALKLRVEKVDDQIAAMELDELLVCDGDAIYPAWSFWRELEAAGDVARLLARPAEKEPRPLPSQEEIFALRGVLAMLGVRSEVADLVSKLDGQQRAAIETARSSKISVLTGGPGTGKTTITRVLLALCAGSAMRVSLCAPTGRAAKRLSQATGRGASTIHRMLEYHPVDGWRRNRRNPLDADLVLVDETSMVDLMLLSRVLEALPDRCRVVIVGDADQLPSIGPGAVLRDLIQCGEIPVARLSTIYRQESGRSLIVSNAHRVTHGLPLDLEEGSIPDDERDLWLVRRSSETALAMILELATKAIPRKLGIDPMRDILVLSPMRKGDLGVGPLNDALQERLNPHGESMGKFRQGDRVMQTKNNYTLGVFNGDVGFVRDFDRDTKELTIEIDGVDIVYPKENQGELVLAYASTVHKAQGGEAPAVVLVLDQSHGFMLRRRLLYTGMTRARRLLVIVGQELAVNKAIADKSREAERFTGLVGRIQESVRGDGDNATAKRLADKQPASDAPEDDGPISEFDSGEDGYAAGK